MKTQTITILIGNSDDKLSQRRWSQYVTECARAVHEWSHQIFFFGSSSSIDLYQNTCWCIEVPKDEVEELYKTLTFIREKYEQDSVAIVIGKGKTRFI